MYRTVTRNLRKRKKIAGTWFLETTTMFSPGDESMAEATYDEADAIREGRKRRGRHRVMFDHRWGECSDLTDADALRLALEEAYGDATLWIDIDGLIDEFYDVRNEENDSRRYFLNARVSSADAWIQEHEWTACKRSDKSLQKHDLVTIGMDGAVRDDATAVVACRVSDGHIELLGLFEKPEGRAGIGWQVDREKVDACMAQAMKDYEVVGVYCDPAHWQDYIDRWQSQWGEEMQVRATVARPMEWWTNKGIPMAQALERFHEAVQEKRITYTNPEDRAGEQQQLALGLTRHVLNARRRVNRSGTQISKDRPKSDKKIDAAVAATLAYEATCDARRLGVKTKNDGFTLPVRVR